MADNITIDTSELDRWTVDVRRAGARVVHNIPKALGVNGNHVKQDARASVRSTFGHIPALPFAINYDVTPTWYGWVLEVGYDRDKPQGNLGHIIEFGRASYDAPNAPQRNLAKGLAANYDDLMTGLRKAVLGGLDF